MPAIVLVDDGSGPEFREIFDQAARFPRVQILRHAVNLGINQGDLDLYSLEPRWRSSVTFKLLGPGRHLLVIRVTGQSRAASTGKYVDLDSLEVR